MHGVTPGATQEDYLRAIYCSEEQNQRLAKSIDIVNYLNVSKPAVSEMLKKLKQMNYIEMSPYSSIKLTANGKKEATKITYKHRIIELFLHEILGFNKDEVHEEAHKLEHSTSMEVVKRMANLLSETEYCPCGHKIPKLL